MKISKNGGLLIFTLLLAASFVLLNFGSTVLFGKYFADFTAERSLSLRPETEKMLSSLKTPITVRLYVSPGIEKDYPQTWQYSHQIVRLFEQYRTASKGMLNYDVQYPKPYDNVAKEAEKLGLKSFYDTGGKNIMYFGALIAADRGDSYIVPNFVELRRNRLESDLNRLIINLNEDRRQPQIGVMAPEQQAGNSRLPLLNAGREWNFLNQLTNDYRLVPVSPLTVQIGVEINTLIVVVPSFGLTPATLYALDQFVLRGGNLLLFVDSLNEQTNRIMDDKNIKKLLKNWGVEISATKAVGDKNNAEEALFDGQALLYAPWINLPTDNVSRTHPVTKGLNSLIFRSPIALKLSKKEGIKAEPLAFTSDRGGTVNSKVAAMPDKNAVLRSYEDNNKTYDLAVSLEGEFKSMFVDNPLKDTEYAEKMLPHLPESMAPGKVIVIGDIDFIYDDIWSDSEYTERNPVMGIVPWADNGELVLRAVDYLSGSWAYLQNENKPLLWNGALQGKFRETARAPYAEGYQAAVRSLKRLTLSEKQLQDEEKRTRLNLTQVKELESIKKNISEQENTIRELNYKIEQNVTRQAWIFMACVFVPGVMMALAAVAWIRICRRLRRYRNPLEDAHE